MRWESLVSIYNLRLAWRRISTGRNLQHKKYFRDFYFVYETALKDNLKKLRQELLKKVWKPSHPHIIYLPKPSGLQRPLTLLSIEDQILLQAISNLCAKKLFHKRKAVELSNVFSNILTEPLDSIFFLKPWQQTYFEFQKKCKSLHREGNIWIAHFDLAAYYDTISHDMLIRIISPSNKYPETTKQVKRWFEVWSASTSETITSHGIPQGPVASDFLAEAFFLPIDIKLKNMNVKYVRYVDDIRLFGKNENEVRKAGIILEWLCRDRGLIPQGKKFSILRAKSPEDIFGDFPSIPPNVENEELRQMDEKKAIQLLESCIKGKPLKVIDKSRFRYLMYRAPNSSKILKKILLLFPRHPEHIDAFIAYFGNYISSKSIINKAISILQGGLPYTYVRGEIWHLLARIGKVFELKKVLEIARQDSRERKKCVGLSWGVMNFLIRCQEKKLCRIGTRLNVSVKQSTPSINQKYMSF